MKKQIAILLMILLPAFAFMSCEEGGGINLFTLDQDIAFGKQLDSAILANPTEYPLLDETQYATAYTHLKRVRDAILQSNDLRYADRFEWKVKIIRNDEVINAFAAPGGYMYFYTGLIKFLDNEAQFAGVMAHEMAHADRRHSTEVMTKQYGFSLLLSILLGDNPSMLETIIAQLAQGATELKFSRSNEYEADEYSIRYLYDTAYDPMGIAGFFQKMMGNTQKIPEFLSTHPSDANRLENITLIWEDLGSKTGETYSDRYNQFKLSLP